MEKRGNTIFMTTSPKLWVIWYAVLTTEYCDYVTTVTRVSESGIKGFGWGGGVDQDKYKKIYEWVK